MVVPCELWQLGFHCEISNWMTMTIELGIAMPLAYYFFRRQQKIINEQEKQKIRQHEYTLNEVYPFIQHLARYTEFILIYLNNPKKLEQFKKLLKTDDPNILNLAKLNDEITQIEYGTLISRPRHFRFIRIYQMFDLASSSFDTELIMEILDDLREMEKYFKNSVNGYPELLNANKKDLETLLHSLKILLQEIPKSKKILEREKRFKKVVKRLGASDDDIDTVLSY